MQEGVTVPNAMSEEMSEQMSEETAVELTALETRILSLLSLKPSHTAKSLAQECDISPRTVERYLKQLQLSGWLQRVGPNKGGSWRVVKR